MMKTSAWAHHNGEYGPGGVWVWYRTGSRRNPQFAWFDTLEAFRAWYRRKLNSKYAVMITSGHWAALDAADELRHSNVGNTGIAPHDIGHRPERSIYV